VWNLKERSHFNVFLRNIRNIVLYQALRRDDYTIKVNWNYPVGIKVWFSAELSEAFCVFFQPFHVTSMFTASHATFQPRVYSGLQKLSSCVVQSFLWKSQLVNKSSFHEP
jgi:hypothetical protein